MIKPYYPPAFEDETAAVEYSPIPYNKEPFTPETYANPINKIHQTVVFRFVAERIGERLHWVQELNKDE